jgi:hypothetical protein
LTGKCISGNIFAGGKGCWSAKQMKSEFPVTFSPEARAAGQQNSQKASSRCSFYLNFPENVIYTGLQLVSDDSMTR